MLFLCECLLAYINTFFGSVYTLPLFEAFLVQLYLAFVSFNRKWKYVFLLVGGGPEGGGVPVELPLCSAWVSRLSTSDELLPLLSPWLGDMFADMKTMEYMPCMGNKFRCVPCSKNIIKDTKADKELESIIPQGNRELNSSVIPENISKASLS